MKEKNKVLYIRFLFTLAIFSSSLSILKLIIGITEGIGLRFWIADILATLIGVTFWYKSENMFKEGEKP